MKGWKNNTLNEIQLLFKITCDLHINIKYRGNMYPCLLKFGTVISCLQLSEIFAENINILAKFGLIPHEL